MNIHLGELKPGEYREVTEQEYKQLLALIQNSSNAPVKEQVKSKNETNYGQGKYGKRTKN